jgi:hypothetical protein
MLATNCACYHKVNCIDKRATDQAEQYQNGQIQPFQLKKMVWNYKSKLVYNSPDQNGKFSCSNQFSFVDIVILAIARQRTQAWNRKHCRRKLSPGNPDSPQ